MNETLFTAAVITVSDKGFRGEEREKTSREFEEDCWRAIK